MKKHIAIVGAGIAGLSAGIFALKSGFDVTIYEQHSIAGGFCTSWRRKGYTFEGAVHWLTGSNKRTSLYQLWEETGALNDSVKLYYHDPFAVYEYKGKNISLYRDVDKLKAHFLEVSPQDADAIIRLCKDIKIFFGMTIPVSDVKGVKTVRKTRITLSQIIAMMPAIFNMKRFSTLSTEEYARMFKHEGIRSLLTHCVVPKELGSMSLLVTLATFAKDGAFPEGGSLGIVKRMTEEFLSLGGKLLLSTKVDQVIVRENKAAGVSVQGTAYSADSVIITEDTRSAVDQLLHTQLRDPWVTELKDNMKPQLCTFVSIGVRADLSGLPHLFAFKPDTPIICGGIEHDMLGFTNYASHREYAPQGCTALTVVFIGDTYNFWYTARQKGTYEEEKLALAERVKSALIKKLPTLENAIEVMDVATPLTYERYTGAFKGSWMTVMRKDDRMRSYPNTCSIDNLYFAGQRIQPPGGLPTAVLTGRKVAQLLCKRYDMTFLGASGK